MITHLTNYSRLKLQVINGDGFLIPRSSKRDGVRRRGLIGTCPFHNFDSRCRRRLLCGSSRMRSWGGGGENRVSAVSGDGSDGEISDWFDDDDEENENEEEDEDEEEFYEFEMEEDDGLSCFRGLVLDISYRPVNIVCWKRAICMEYMEKADVLEYYDRAVNSPSGSFYIPAVLRVPYLLQVVKKKMYRSIILSRRNILRRDDYTCQYCCAGEDLTVDHVVPVSRGGERTWENLVAACSSCNCKKGHKTLEEADMTLIKMPKAPKEADVFTMPLRSVVIHTLKKKKEMPEEWQQYLPKS